MLTKIEGIILSKVPYDERHVIANVMLRNGKKITVVFYGGRGGGKKQKSSILELGFMLSIELQTAKRQTDVYHAKEWNLIWHYDLIRLNHQSFYQLCLFLEISNKISPQEDLHDLDLKNQEMAGLFSTLSNALVLMEKSLEAKQFFPHSHSVIYFTKLFLHSGIYPERENCTICGEELIKFNDMFLLPDEGGFSCPVCMNERKRFGVQSGRELWELMGHIAHKKYSELYDLKLEFKSLPVMLFHYFCYQHHFEEKDFKSSGLVF
jgi:recombinational DNA repair protein (RecF pathway)